MSFATTGNKKQRDIRDLMQQGQGSRESLKRKINEVLSPHSFSDEAVNDEKVINDRHKQLRNTDSEDMINADISKLEKRLHSSTCEKKVADHHEQSSIGTFQELISTDFLGVAKKLCMWRNITAENLALQICDRFYNKKEASALLAACEQELTYNVGDLATIKIFGKQIEIPRKQVAHGDPGLTYTFSGNTIPARPWTPLLTNIRDQISQATGYTFNFVLINRYKDGHDYMGEHKDDEKDLVHDHPIASLTLGQPRDFVFKHQDSRGKNASRKLDPVVLQLEHGMLLLMKHPTNSFWYHSLPRRTRALGLRINMTFRKMEVSNCKQTKLKQ